MRRWSSPARSLSARRKLLAAFCALAAVFLGAFALQAHGLWSIEGHLTELEDHDEQARLALALDDALRGLASHLAPLLGGAADHLADYREARGRAGALVVELTRRVDEPEATGWVADIAEASRQLDALVEARLAPASGSGAEAAGPAQAEAAALVARMASNVDRIFAFLREATARYHDEVRRLERSTLRLMLFFLVSVPLVALAAGFYLARSVTRPLAKLGAGAARVALGDLVTPIDLDTPDEFGALAAEFNRMTGAVREGQARLVKAEKLASIGRVAAGVAHELNDPLQVILGYVSLDRHRVAAPVAGHLAKVEREALRCKEIVEGLLHLARPPIPVPLEPVDLRAVAEEVAGAVRHAQGPVPELSVEGSAVALAAPGRVRQIVFNLCRNAADSAGAGGRVALVAAEADGAVELAVVDSGPGVPEELRERIFEPFFTTKPGGTGLGLPTARALAQALGGDLLVGQPAGGGGRFTLRLPRAPAGGAP